MKEQILKTCARMLVPPIRLLLRAGIGWNEFAELGKQIFVDVARQDYGLQGRPTNSARVALMTGLSRREVGRLRKLLTGKEPVSVESKSRISQVLSGWHLDPEFLDEQGQPGVLPEDGDSGSLTALLHRYAGDIPHGALIKELIQLGLVRQDGETFEVLARDYIRGASDPDLLRQGSLAMHDHGATVVHNVAADREGEPRFERMATRIDVDPEDAVAFEHELNRRGQAFLEEMDRFLSARRSARGEAPPDRRKVRTGVGMYMIYDDGQGTEDNG